MNPDVRELNFEAGNPTALLLAARGGFPGCVDVLVNAGADLQLSDAFGVTAIHEAAGSPCSDDYTQATVLSKLLQDATAKNLLLNRDAAKCSPVCLAASRGYTACVQLLLEAYDESRRQRVASKALVDAAAAGRIEVTEVLINAGATSVCSSGQLSALGVSRTPRDTCISKAQLLQCVSCVSSHACSGVCASLCVSSQVVIAVKQGAAEQGHTGCVALLLRTAPGKGDLDEALLGAARQGHEHIVRLLVEAGQ